jgi:hypothetical protein
VPLPSMPLGFGIRGSCKDSRMAGQDDKPTRPMSIEEAVRREIQRRIVELDEAERIEQPRQEEREGREPSPESDDSASLPSPPKH